MEDNENIVVETTENVEGQATEELVDGSKVTAIDTAENGQSIAEEKLYSETELNERVNKLLADKIGGKLAQQERRLRKEYEDKYSRVETVLNAGLGTSNLDEATNKLADFYKQKGINIPEQPKYSDRDLDLLANAEADEIIKLGFDEIVEETDRLADKGVERMTVREKLVFTKLAEARQKQEAIKELAKIGVKEEALNDKAYQDFANKLNPNLSPKEKYEMYLKFNPKQKVEPIGSMKTGQVDKVKDYYTEAEIERMTLDDLNDPRVWDAVRKSMTGQN